MSVYRPSTQAQGVTLSERDGNSPGTPSTSAICTCFLAPIVCMCPLLLHRHLQQTLITKSRPLFCGSLPSLHLDYKHKPTPFFFFPRFLPCRSCSSLSLWFHAMQWSVRCKKELGSNVPPSSHTNAHWRDSRSFSARHAAVHGWSLPSREPST